MGDTITRDHNPSSNLTLNHETISNMLSYSCIYHEDEDVLFISPENPKPATSFDWNGEIWLRIDPQTEEIIGIEIENFEKVFIKKHPELDQVWRTVKSSCKHKTKRTNDNTWESFIRIVLEFISSLFENTPQQLVFKATLS